MAYKQPVSVLVVIHTSDLQVLLLERNDFTNAWQSVTGSRESDEALADTACREVLEETGIVADRTALRDWQLQNQYEIFEVWRHRYAPGTLVNTEHVFSLQLPHVLTPVLSPGEHRRHRWVAWQAAAEMVFSPSNAEAIRLLPERLGH